MILCDRARALGIAFIENIDSRPSSRIFHRCPVCRKTGIKKRKTRRPEYRCDDGHEFDRPIQENARCTAYTAQFGTTFRPFTEVFGREFLRQGCPRYSDQLAIQEFDFTRMEAVIRSSYPKAAGIISILVSGSYLPPEDAEDDRQLNSGGYIPIEGDDRQQVLRQIRARRGQRAFRDKLRARYGDQCMISGCRVLHVLEAAHIHPYRGEMDNHVENGVLLRADLHTLFDLDVMGIEPATLTVQFHPEVDQDEYKALRGRKLLCSGTKRPSEEALKFRWEAFKRRATSRHGTNGSV
jgi:ssDNA-binding Zn-finger/Zn-ribbon topoisomerase 1